MSDTAPTPAPAPQSPEEQAKHVKDDLTCPSCGRPIISPVPVPVPVPVRPDTPSEAQRRIAELEAQVSLLTLKATAAADKLADYEDDQRRSDSVQLRPSTDSRFSGSDTTPSQHVRKGSSGSLEHGRDATALSADAAPGRFAGILRSRKATPSPSTARAVSRDADMEAALALERSLRQQAEGKVKHMEAELEELTAQLFSQANQMVAAERKDRAKLEDRVKVLKEKDLDKAKRLERLEAAVKRIDEARSLLVP